MSMFTSLKMLSKKIDPPSIFFLPDEHPLLLLYIQFILASIDGNNQKATFTQNNRLKKEQKITKVSLG